MRAALFLLLAAITAVAADDARPRLETILDEVVGVGPGKIRTLDLPLDEPGVRVIVQYDMIRGLTGVRLLLLTVRDAERWMRGQPHLVQAGTGYGFSGSLTRTLPRAGRYRLVLDNQSGLRAEARVRLRVRLLRNGAMAPPAPPERWRALTVVWASAGLFVAILFWGGLRLKRAFEDRQDRLRADYL